MSKFQTKIVQIFIFIFLVASLISCKVEKQNEESETLKKETINEDKPLQTLIISENQRYFTTEDGEPFFWLGDTGWLAFSKLSREEMDQYIADRKEKGFNVLQIMVLHSLDTKSIYDDAALMNNNITDPIYSPGNSPDNEGEYDYWDHVEYMVQKAAEEKMYMALVPLWGNNVKDGGVTVEQAKEYGEFLGNRFKDYDNVIWLNGGDTFGNEYTDVWNALGEALHAKNPDKLITFHPRGRMQSSDWFHNEEWLDFNMIQSGHRTYEQDDTERSYGEDNWRYIETDWNMEPIKPTVDGEPSYEGIPYGLHDTTLPFWKAHEIRRYAYWSVFAGGAGFTYGHSAVMQMQKDTTEVGAYGNKMHWEQALNEPGAEQMIHLKNLILKFPFFERIPDQSLVANQGERYNYIAATRGTNYALFYTYNGKNIDVNMGTIEGEQVKASWYNPRTGEETEIGEFENGGVQSFDPEGGMKDGNDWVLILTSK